MFHRLFQGWFTGGSDGHPGDPEHHALYEQARDLLLTSAHTIVLTGAGISTPSGIPDFRSPGSGLWEYVDPMEVASIWGFREDPARFYRWIRPLAEKMRRAQPNPAHRGLAELERRGHVHQIITQNIDDLHQQAGSRNVIHLHGRAGRMVCLDCGHSQEDEPFWQEVSAQPEEAVPRCPHCGGLMKPDVVLFGEELPQEALRTAQQAALRCDLVIVVGSSLEVMPAADLPLLAKRRGARLVILNLGRTMADRQADLIIREDVAVSIPRLVQMVQAAEGRR